MTAGSHHHQRDHESSIYIKTNNKKGKEDCNQTVVDDGFMKKKIWKIYIRMGWISISRIIGRHDPAGKSGRVYVIYLMLSDGGISSECKKDMGLMRGNFIARLCKSSSLLLGTQRAVYIYDHLYQHLWSKMALPFFISYCCVFLSQLCIRNNSLHEYIKPCWARSNNLRCLLMINDPSRSKEKAATMLSYAPQ